MFLPISIGYVPMIRTASKRVQIDAIVCSRCLYLIDDTGERASLGLTLGIEALAFAYHA
jgi:hypothetical protein